MNSAALATTPFPTLGGEGAVGRRIWGSNGWSGGRPAPAGPLQGWASAAAPASSTPCASSPQGLWTARKVKLLFCSPGLNFLKCSLSGPRLTPTLSRNTGAEPFGTSVTSLGRSHVISHVSPGRWESEAFSMM